MKTLKTVGFCLWILHIAQWELGWVQSAQWIQVCNRPLRSTSDLTKDGLYENMQIQWAVPGLHIHFFGVGYSFYLTRRHLNKCMWSESVSLSVMNNFCNPMECIGAQLFFSLFRLPYGSRRHCPAGIHSQPCSDGLWDFSASSCNVHTDSNRDNSNCSNDRATVRKVLWKVFVNQIYSSYCINLATSDQLKFRHISHACSKHLLHITRLETGKYNLSAVWGSEHDKGVLPLD